MTLEEDIKMERLEEDLAAARLIIATLVQAVRKGPNWLLMQGLASAEKFLEDS